MIFRMFKDIKKDKKIWGQMNQINKIRWTKAIWKILMKIQISTFYLKIKVNLI